MSASPVSPAAQPLVLRADAHGVATLTLNRPAQRNALSMSLMDALGKALGQVALDPAIKVVVLAGAGPAFCAGHDLKELRASPSRAGYEDTFRLCSALMQIGRAHV
jgi:enoyl-CoA hydratase/carnithine racemase